MTHDRFEQILDASMRDMKNFNMVGKTEKELVIVELSGKEAIIFRLLRNLCDDEPKKKQAMMTEILRSGIQEHANVVKGFVFKELMSKLFKEGGDGSGRGEEDRRQET